MIFFWYRWLLLTYNVNCFVENYTLYYNLTVSQTFFCIFAKLTKTEMQRDKQIF
jgi:hypothetical protein